ncbi:MAG: pyruvate, water dikinase, partial [Pseudonocardia sp.]
MGPDGCTAVLLGAARRADSRMPCMRFIRRFDELARDDVDVAGGKGANLGELTRAGFPVPPGFVLTTDAYRAVVEA